MTEFNGATLMITGGTGSFGNTVLKHYTDENVSDKVVKIIQSYTGVVNRMVWRKG